MSIEFSQSNQVVQVQYEAQPYGGEQPSQQYPYRRETPLDTAVIGITTALVMGVLLGLAIWSWGMWKLPEKAGYNGVVRFLWFVFLAFPLTTGSALIAFVLVKWPVQKELDKVRERRAPVDDIDDELRRLRSNL